MGILDVVTIMLEMEGYEVVTALDAAIALARIETTAPDLILLDVALPTIGSLLTREKPCPCAYSDS